MKPDLRKFVLTAHIASSVGWLGAVIGFLVLTIAGLTSQEVRMVQAVYLASEPMTRLVIVPLALASLLSGVVQSLGARWGLFRHYWVLFKLVLTVLATAVLLAYTQTVTHFADTARETAGASADGLASYAFHSAGGLVILIVTTIRSVYKPAGTTPYGERKA